MKKTKKSSQTVLGVILLLVIVVVALGVWFSTEHSSSMNTESASLFGVPALSTPAPLSVVVGPGYDTRVVNVYSSTHHSDDFEKASYTITNNTRGDITIRDLNTTFNFNAVSSTGTPNNDFPSVKVYVANIPVQVGELQPGDTSIPVDYILPADRTMTINLLVDIDQNTTIEGNVFTSLSVTGTSRSGRKYVSDTAIGPVITIHPPSTPSSNPKNSPGSSSNEEKSDPTTSCDDSTVTPPSQQIGFATVAVAPPQPPVIAPPTPTPQAGCLSISFVTTPAYFASNTPHIDMVEYTFTNSSSEPIALNDLFWNTGTYITNDGSMPPISQSDFPNFEAFDSTGSQIGTTQPFISTIQNITGYTIPANTTITVNFYVDSDADDTSGTNTAYTVDTNFIGVQGVGTTTGDVYDSNPGYGVDYTF